MARCWRRWPGCVLAEQVAYLFAYRVVARGDLEEAAEGLAPLRRVESVVGGAQDEEQVGVVPVTSARDRRVETARCPARLAYGRRAVTSPGTSTQLAGNGTAGGIAVLLL